MLDSPTSELLDDGTSTEPAWTGAVAVVVPHTHWDREWYAPFETMRFQLVRFFDQLVETLESEPSIPAFVLDGQAVIVEDYLEIRPSQRPRVAALVAAGRLRPGPFYVQPDEFHVSGEAIVRNLVQGIAASGELGWVMREGYLPDTFGHVAQLPQILRGFGIETFYAMRGFGQDASALGSEFWWEAPDGSRVLVEWLTESYSNAAVLTPDPEGTSLHHGALVQYDSLPELLGRLDERSRTGVLLLLNGGDHLRVQRDLPAIVRSLDRGVDVDLQLGGLEEFHALTAARPAPSAVVRGELRHGGRVDVFDGIGSTRTPMKSVNDHVEAHLAGVAERLDALAWLVDGSTSMDSLRYAWRELLKNHAHDSICGCSVDEVHREMAMRYAKVSQVSEAVAQDALERLAHAVAPEAAANAVPIVVVNLSSHPRSGVVDVDVLPDLDAPVGERLFGWLQGAGVDWSGYALISAAGDRVPFSVAREADVVVADPLDRRKELLRDRITFSVDWVPALGAATYVLVPEPGSTAVVPVAAAAVTRSENALHNGILRVEVAADGTLSLTHLASGRNTVGLLEFLDDGDAGDEYSFGPVPGDSSISSRTASWSVTACHAPNALRTTAALIVPRSLTPDRADRSAATVELSVTVDLALAPGADRLHVTITVDNNALDHRVRVRFPTGVAGGETIAETAFGTIVREAGQPRGTGWREPPSGARALLRFVAANDETGGVQILTEGLHEYAVDESGTIDVTLLRGVGWLARTDHPLRPHKVGPQVPTPEAQCTGEQTFRLALRPFQTPDDHGHLHRAAEEVSVPLQAIAVQGRRRAAEISPVEAGALLGLATTPDDVVLSAVKVAEDGDGVVVRIFNSSSSTVAAALDVRDRGIHAELCDLEERTLSTIVRDDDGAITVPLRGGQIATLRLRRAGRMEKAS